MDISSLNSTQSFPGTETHGNSDIDKNAFLKLLMAQLQNQDPMEPMSNSDFVAQMAQFSSVEQLQAVNEGINLLGAQQGNLANAQASSFIDKGVLVRSDKLEVSNTDISASAGFTLLDNADSVLINIRDSQGQVVRSMKMAQLPAGPVQVDWDLINNGGIKVPPGSYRFDIVAQDASGNSVSYEPQVEGRVNGVSYENGYPELVIGTNIKASLSDIIEVYK
ncbi:MAG: hypothetical protein JXR91_11215 [Deltaproteobacteria bacterium]|nr:hypothetical protein [Deltaproteobacteria bacterium]